MKTNDMQFSTLGGSIVALGASFDWNNLIQTVWMTIVGTVISYCCSRILQRLRKRK